MQRLIPIILLVLSAAITVTARDWRGILPMHSTREHVEALLGPPPQPPEGRAYLLHPGRSIYFFDEGEVYIVFADADFLAQNHCQSVAVGTVVYIEVTLPDETSLKFLNLDEKRFKKFNPVQPQLLGNDYQGYLDENEGLVIRARKGNVEKIVYAAAASDRARCPGPYEDLEEFVRIHTMVCGLGSNEYGDIRFSDEKGRLDNFAIQLQNEPDKYGYIVVYAGHKAVVAEAQLRANRARDYLINVRKIDPQKVKAIDGGYQLDLSVRLYILPAGTEPPLMPTIDPKDVELIYEKKRSREKGH